MIKFRFNVPWPQNASLAEVNILLLWGTVFINRCSSEAISIWKNFLMPKKARTKAMGWSCMVIIGFGKCALLIVRKLSFILVSILIFSSHILFFFPMCLSVFPVLSTLFVHYLNSVISNSQRLWSDFTCLEYWCSSLKVKEVGIDVVSFPVNHCAIPLRSTFLSTSFLLAWLK